LPELADAIAKALAKAREIGLIDDDEADTAQAINTEHKKSGASQ
jgi:hypothetical protein